MGGSNTKSARVKPNTSLLIRPAKSSPEPEKNKPLEETSRRTPPPSTTTASRRKSPSSRQPQRLSTGDPVEACPNPLAPPPSRPFTPRGNQQTRLSDARQNTETESDHHNSLYRNWKDLYDFGVTAQADADTDADGPVAEEGDEFIPHTPLTGDPHGAASKESGEPGTGRARRGVEATSVTTLHSHKNNGVEEFELGSDEDNEQLDDFVLASRPVVAPPSGWTSDPRPPGVLVSHPKPHTLKRGEQEAAERDASEVVEFVSLRAPGYRRCRNCLVELPFGANFCPSCGARVGVPRRPRRVSSFADDSSETTETSSSWSSMADTSLRSSVGSSPATPNTNHTGRRRGYIRRVRVMSQSEGGLLGTGVSGEVYRAIDILTGQLLAVKEMRVSPHNETEIEGIRRELRSLSALRHPNIVDYLGCSIEKIEGNETEADALHGSVLSANLITLSTNKTKKRECRLRVRILMERLECGSLATLLQQFPNGVPENTVRVYAAQLVQALSHVHRSGITHRDIKPANILLGSDGTIKITDFGSAVLTASLVQGPDTELVAGSPAYMPPETVAKVGPTEWDGAVGGIAQDLWALGCVIHQLLTGLVPWGETRITNPYALLLHIKDRPFPISDSLSPVAKDFCSRCFLLDPRQRVAAADSLLTHSFLVTEAPTTNVRSSQAGAVAQASFHQPPQQQQVQQRQH